MKIYEALYNPMTEESAYTTLSLHLTKDGAERAIEDHKNKELEKWQRYHPSKELEPHRFGQYQDWLVDEVDVLP